MPWQESHVHEQRLAFVAAAMRPGANRRALCREFGISAPTGYKWLARVVAEGLVVGVRERSRRPHHSPGRIAPALEAEIVEARRQFGWAGRKLRPLLGARCGSATIDRVIRRQGLTDPDEQHRPAPQRFVAPAPNALWQMDFKGQYPVQDGWTFPLSILDDHSRFAIDLAALRGTRAVPVQAVLTRCFQRFGVPDAMLLDHGVPWWSPANGHGLTQLTVFLLEQNIRLTYCGFAHPQTQGKVERFHRTLGRRLRQWGVPTTHAGMRATLTRFRTEYNTVRPHEALGDQPPAARYQPSPRAFQSEPQPWPYPPTHVVLRVNANGALHVDRRVFYISDALAHREVGCQQIGDRVLVTFRHLTVREIDLRTGRTHRGLESSRP
jgi:transposase InsO family protein